MSETWEDVYNQKFTRPTLEDPIVGRWWLLEQAEPPTPVTMLEALIATEPNAPPPTSIEEREAAMTEVAARIAEIVETELSEEERAVVEVIGFGGHTVREAAELLGWPKSTVHRLKVSAFDRIKRLMNEEG